MDEGQAACAAAIAALLFDDDQGACTRALLTQLNAVPMRPFEAATESADGAGVYLLFHVGDHPLYNGLTEDCPLYVGKAIGDGSGARSQLETRLRDHQKSLRQADDLRCQDFGYKVLRINEDWVAGCESVLIRHWQPLWNTVITGFGNHAPGRGRQLQRKSLWDTLHQGRRWADLLDPEVPYAYVAELVAQWCHERGYPARAAAPSAHGAIAERFVV
jgi:hypothetical protein